MDILDVWLIQGFPMRRSLREEDLGSPADLYLEGSDRTGVVPKLPLTSVGTRGRAPIDPS